MPQDILQMLGTGAVSVTGLFAVIWLAHIVLKNAGVVDVGWGVGFILLCAVYVMLGAGLNTRNTLLLVMIALWGLRIALYLLKRLASDPGEDRRYQKMRAEWGGNIHLKFFFFFQFQAVLELILAVPFLIISLNAVPGLTLFEIAGAVLFIAALVGETIADEQLFRFKQDPANTGKVLDRGLWRYSRHPNYFFEWLVWVGIFVYALGSPHGWAAVVSPLVMLYLMLYVSGVPLSEEQALRSRGEAYRRYQAGTSVFFPWPGNSSMRTDRSNMRSSC